MVERLTLDLSQLDETITPRTRLVALGRASNAVGTITDIRSIAEVAHDRGTPTFSFTMAGYSPRAVAGQLARHGVFVGDGSFYASTLDERLGTSTTGGWTRVGLAPYTTADELARCLAVLHDLADRRAPVAG
jgi:selenocysteine lyase/cysteine desulfurase